MQAVQVEGISMRSTINAQDTSAKVMMEYTTEAGSFYIHVRVTYFSYMQPHIKEMWRVSQWLNRIHHGETNNLRDQRFAGFGFLLFEDLLAAAWPLRRFVLRLCRRTRTCAAVSCSWKAHCSNRLSSFHAWSSRASRSSGAGERSSGDETREWRSFSSSWTRNAARSP